MKLICFLLTFCSLSFTTWAQGKKQPNIVVILADDLGFSDIGCYGAEINTPNLDKLAGKGVRFTQFYNASRCCPSRAALLTGQYNHNAGIGDMTTDQKLAGYRGYLTENTVTIAEVLKTAGYQTGMVGKWHVANTAEQAPKENHLKWLAHQKNVPYFAPIEQYPTRRGFDKFYGTIWGVVDFFDPFSLVNGEKPVEKVDKNYYYTDALNDTAVSYIETFNKNKKPFFLYVAHTAPHWPLQAFPEDIDKYKDVYKKGWDEIRYARFKKMVDNGLFPKGLELPERWKKNKQWDENPDKDWDAHAMAVKAAMIERMDAGIGRIIEKLEKTGQMENTLILFLSDNGASSDNAQNYGPGFDRAGSIRTGEEVIFPIDKKVLPGPQNTFASTDDMWSNVSNTPFRFWKTKQYEGGICTPLIAYWPGHTQKGTVSTTPGHIIDFMPTFMEMSGAAYPKTFKGNTIDPFAGISLLSVLKGGKPNAREYLFFEHLRSKAVRYGDWKLVSLNDNAPWALYNIKSDRTEIHDLSSKHPALVKQLETAWMDWALKTHVLPKPEPQKKKGE